MPQHRVAVAVGVITAAQLRADTLITLDRHLADAAKDLVTVAPIEALYYIDLDLSVENLLAGSLLAVGQAMLQVSEAPHLGCAKFAERFGAEAMRLVKSGTGRQQRLRGMNARVVRAGLVRLGDLAAKFRADLAAG